MSGTAKFFVVLNLILSLLYLGATAVLFGYREDFKTKFLKEESAHKETKKTLEAQRDELQKDLDLARNDIRSKDTQIDTLNRDYEKANLEIKRLNAQFDDMQRKINDLETHVSALKTQVDEKDTLIENLSKDKDKFRNDFEAAREAKERALAEQTRLQNENTRLQEQLANLEKSYIVMAKKMKDVELVLEDLVRRGIEIKPVKYKPISGKISAVRPEWHLVMINIGEKDDVQKGMPFIISRGPNYVGKIIVDEVYPDMAAGMILVDQTLTTPQVGDDVRYAP